MLRSIALSLSILPLVQLPVEGPSRSVLQDQDEQPERDPRNPRDREAAACHVDVACPEGEGWRDAARSVVRIVGRVETCTGVLLNNTDRDGTPYVLTAGHCGSLRNATFFFGWQREECGGDAPEHDWRVTGSTLVASDDLFDVQLVRLNAQPPAEARPLYAGWDRSGRIVTGATTLHHPWGDVMKVSHERNKPKKDGIYWRINRWEVGITERGSSGAPLFDAAGRVIGQLKGGDATCEEPVGDLFGRLEREWPLLGEFLDPDASGVPTLDAYDPALADQADEPPLGIALHRFTPDPVPYGASRVVVVGRGFTVHTIVYLDGARLPPSDVTLLSNSRLALALPPTFAVGEHRVGLIHHESGNRVKGSFEVAPVPPSPTPPTPPEDERD